jgi:NitT/TauT family transport system ATP-binding protein
MNALLHLRSIDKIFASGAQALAGLDLTIHDGEFLSLLGPSGCGKSTALRLIAGLMQPTSGALEWTSGKPDIGFVFQDAVLMPWASAFDNVWLPLRLNGRSRKAAQKDVEAALDSVGLSGFANAYPRELSGGMKMRVSIARALVQRPKLLLMDEPFAALDEITRLKLNDDLLRVTRELGTTVVFVTHSVFESAYLSSRIAVFSSRPGRIIETITIDAPPARTESFRLSPLYGEACQKASAALHRAMGEPS